MVEGDIIVPIDSKIHGDMEDVMFKRLTPREKHRRQAVNKQQEFTKLRKPYCYRCCLLDFEDEQERIAKRRGAKGGDPERVIIESFDFEQYGKPSHFKQLDSVPVIEKKLIDGIRTDYQTGNYEEYQCKSRGGKISVEIPLKKAEQRWR